MRRLISLFFDYVARRFEGVLRRASDSLTARIMLAQALRDTEAPLLDYRGWVVSLSASNGLLMLVAGRRTGAKLEDIGAFLGALVRASGSLDPAMPPFQVVSPSGRFVAWGWRPDGRELSAKEQIAILGAVLGRRERVFENWKDLN